MHEHLEVAERRNDFLDAHHGDQRLRQGQAHPAVPLGFDHRERAGFGDTEVGAADRDPRRKEFAPQVLARGHCEDPRLVGQLTDVGHFTHEDVADLGSVAVDRGHQDVAGPVVAELDDQLCEVGLDRGDALGFQVLVEADLWVAIDLTLTTSSAPVAWIRPVTMRLASSASRARCTTPPASRDVTLELLK